MKRLRAKNRRVYRKECSGPEYEYSEELKEL
jgi:hypothetical protein